MTTIDFVRMSLEMSHGWIMGLIQDMKDSPTTAPTPNGGNHPLWVLGHLTFSEGVLVNGFVQGKENPLADWTEMFGMGSQPEADAAKYPSMDELASKFEQIRGQTLELLDTLTEEDLDKPSHAPEESGEFFGTIGQCLAALSIHFAFHGGQVADARRAAGRGPVMG